MCGMSSGHNSRRFACALVAVAICAAAPASAASFKYTDIDDPGYIFTAAIALNDEDQVVGYVEDSHNNQAGMAWSNGVSTEVSQAASFVAIDMTGLAAGENAKNGSRSKTYVTYHANNGQIGSNAIHGEQFIYLVGGNANGDVIAYTKKTLHGLGIGLLVNGNTSTDISYPNSLLTQVFAINKTGEVVGMYIPSGENSEVLFSYKAGSYTTYAYPDDYPPSIGPDGTIGGSYKNGSGVVVGFLLQKKKYTTVSFPNATATYVNDVGPGGEAVGQFSSSSGEHGFIYRGGKYYQIDYPGSTSTVVTHVNALGSLIGAYDNADSQNHAFIAQCSSGDKCTE